MANTISVSTIDLYQEVFSASQALQKAADGLKKIARLLQKTKKTDFSQAWYWSKEWQKMEKEADEDIRKRYLVELKNIDDLDKPFKKLFPNL